MNKIALVVIDMLSAYDFEDSEKLVESVERALPQMEQLIGRAREQGAPVIYVNDIHGHWRSDPDALVKQALEGEQPQLVRPILPDDDAWFVVKARHSIFYETLLGYLVNSEEIDSLVMIGQVTEQCILYSALDAHIRHIPTVVPRDAVAHIDEELVNAALRMMETNMDARVVDSGEVDFSG